MKTIEEYAIELVVDGATAGAYADADHQAACDLAIKIAHAIRDNPQVVLELVAAAKGEAHG